MLDKAMTELIIYQLLTSDVTAFIKRYQLI